MDDIKLKKGQAIQNVSARKTDNDGFVLRFTLYKESKTYSESQWEDKEYSYPAGSKDQVLADVAKLYELMLS